MARVRARFRASDNYNMLGWARVNRLGLGLGLGLGLAI